MSNPEYLPVGLNGLTCAIIVFVCICRLDKIDKRVLLRVGVQYVLLLMAAATFGASPWLFDMPGWPSVFFSGAVMIMLVADSYQWRRGAPASATGPAPLGDQ
jgi:heme A synthase